MPLDALTAVVRPDPYPWYRRLAAEHPVAPDPTRSRWVVAGDAVAAVLTDDRFAVRPVPDPGPPSLVAALARTTDGARHRHHRTATVARLAALDGDHLRSLARATTGGLLAGAGPLDPSGLDRLVTAGPVATMAAALGTAVDDVDALVHLVTRVARGLAVPLTPAERDDALDAADDLVAGAGGWPAVAALVQTLDATAGLVGNALVARARGSEASDATALVGATALTDPAVHNTRRWARTAADVGGHRLPAGAEVVVVLASNVDPFGWGAHRCPGDELAQALAAGVVEALAAAVDPVTAVVRSPRYRPRPNVRIPWFGGGPPAGAAAHTAVR